MAKRPQQTWPDALESLARESVNMAARWLPRGLNEAERQARRASKEYRDFRRRRQEAAALKPRKALLL